MKLKQINIVKVENGYVVASGEKNYIAEDEEKVKLHLFDSLLPFVLEELNKVEPGNPPVPVAEVEMPQPAPTPEPLKVVEEETKVA